MQDERTDDVILCDQDPDLSPLIWIPGCETLFCVRPQREVLDNSHLASASLGHSGTVLLYLH